MKLELLGFILTIIFLSNFVTAQVIDLTAEELYAIAVILLVIVAIAIAAGWRVKVGIPTGMIVFGLIVLLLVIFPFIAKIPEKVVIPENWKLAKLPDFFVKGMVYLGLPKEWGYVPAFIYLVLLPFTAIFAVTWGFLRQLGIFEEKVIRVLSLLIAFSTIPLGILTKVVYFYLGISGFLAISTFVVTFMLGLFLLAFRKVSVYELKTTSIRALRKRLGDLYKQYTKIEEELAKERAKPEPDHTKITTLQQKSSNIWNAIEKLEERIRKLT
jgi:hypothetical protein